MLFCLNISWLFSCSYNFSKRNLYDTSLKTSAYPHACTSMLSKPKSQFPFLTV